MEKPYTAKRSQAQWQQILQDQQSSGLTISDYCKRSEISLSSFYQWRSKLGFSAKNQKRIKTDTVNLAEDWIALPSQGSTDKSSSWDVELNLPHGVTLKMRAV